MSNRMTQMYREVRRPALIREEIKDLLELITENKKLLSEFPERISLRFRDIQFSERLVKLKEELEESRIVFRENQRNV